MKRIMAVSLIALGLAGCTAREQQLLAAGAVGAVAGAVVANEVSQPRPVYVEQRPVVYQERYVVPRRPQCYVVERRTYYGIERERVCR